MKCPICGATVSAESSFCRNCGTRPDARFLQTDETTEQVTVTETIVGVSEKMKSDVSADKHQTVHKPKPKINLVIMTLAVCMIMILTVVLFVSGKVAGESETGNTAGNINNMGLVAENDGWVYYVNFSQNNALYKMRTDGQGTAKVGNASGYNLNVVGGWIYYTDMKDGHLYRIHTDGSAQEQLLQFFTGNAQVIDNWIYYCSGNYGGIIYRMRTDGTKNTQLVTGNYSNVNVADGWIYCLTDRQQICKIRTDGTEETALTAEGVESSIYDEGWIFYCTQQNEIYKIKPDGSQNILLFKSNPVSSADTISFMNVSGGWIYFIKSGQILRMRTDGSECTVLTETYASYLNIADGWLFFLEISSKPQLYKMRTDGTELQEVQ